MLRYLQQESDGTIIILGASAHVVTVASSALDCVNWCESISVCILQESRQQAGRDTVNTVTSSLVIAPQPMLDLIPKLLRNDPFVFARVTLSLVTNLAEVDGIVKNFVECTARELGATKTSAVCRFPNLAPNALLIQPEFEFRDAAKLQVMLKRIRPSCASCWFTFSLRSFTS